ncbi:MAG: PilZ domain-containing protein [Desulfohalobiaceae bacterium]
MQVIDPQNLQTCLEAAKDQRSKFIVSMPEEATSISSLNCTLEDFDQEHLYLEDSSLRQGNSQWVGLEVTCYFRLLQRKRGQKETFFNFSASIKRVGKNQSGFVELVLERPSRLDIGQRRASMRIQLDLRYILGFYLWEESSFIRPKQQEQKPGLYPPRLHLEHVRSGSLRIMDISAGGMRLRMPSKTSKDLGLQWEQGTLLVIWITLLEPSDGKKQQYWLKARVKYQIRDSVGRDLDLGLEFTHYGRIDASKKLKWIRVQDNVLEELATWTQRRYLDAFRQGLAD